MFEPVGVRHDEHRHFCMSILANRCLKLRQTPRRRDRATIVSPTFRGNAGKLNGIPHGGSFANFGGGPPSTHNRQIFLASEYDFNWTRLPFDQNLESHSRRLAQSQVIGKSGGNLPLGVRFSFMPQVGAQTYAWVFRSRLRVNCAPGVLRIPISSTSHRNRRASINATLAAQ